MKRTVVFVFSICLFLVFTSMSFENEVSSIAGEAALGKKLFSEKILSQDSSVSCADCHKPAYAFADTTAFSTGIGEKLTTRNTPSVLNMANRPYYFWDGRAASLQLQSLLPIQNPGEMGLAIEEAVKRLNQSTLYTNLFKKVFNQPASAKNVGLAFAAYEKTLETVDSKFDDWSNDRGKLTAAEERGRKLFTGDKAKCFNCHSGPDFTTDEFKNIGLYNGATLNDAGRYTISTRTADEGKFKIPGLRNIAVTAPYMHNGIFKTLEEVISYYNDPGKIVPGAINIDDDLKKPLGLTASEQKDLVAFLKTLTDKKYKRK